MPVMCNPLLGQFTMQVLLDDPVDLQIRVSADWRGEMAVILAGQPEMSGTFCRVSCLFHLAEHHLTNQCLIRLAFNLIEYFLQFLWMSLVSRRLDK